MTSTLSDNNLTYLSIYLQQQSCGATGTYRFHVGYVFIHFAFSFDVSNSLWSACSGLESRKSSDKQHKIDKLRVHVGFQFNYD